MEYKVNESIFVREEVQDSEKIYFVYVGDEDEMYKLNESSYDCFLLIQAKVPTEEIYVQLHQKYSMTSLREIKAAVDSIIDEFLEIGLISCKRD